MVVAKLVLRIVPWVVGDECSGVDDRLGPLLLLSPSAEASFFNVLRLPLLLLPASSTPLS